MAGDRAGDLGGDGRAWLAWADDDYFDGPGELTALRPPAEAGPGSWADDGLPIGVKSGAGQYRVGGGLCTSFGAHPKNILSQVVLDRELGRPVGAPNLKRRIIDGGLRGGNP